MTGNEIELSVTKQEMRLLERALSDLVAKMTRFGSESTKVSELILKLKNQAGN